MHLPGLAAEHEDHENPFGIPVSIHVTPSSITAMGQWHSGVLSVCLGRRHRLPEAHLLSGAASCMDLLPPPVWTVFDRAQLAQLVHAADCCLLADSAHVLGFVSLLLLDPLPLLGTPLGCKDANHQEDLAGCIHQHLLHHSPVVGHDLVHLHLQ